MAEQSVSLRLLIVPDTPDTCNVRLCLCVGTSEELKDEMPRIEGVLTSSPIGCDETDEISDFGFLNDNPIENGTRDTPILAASESSDDYQTKSLQLHDIGLGFYVVVSRVRTLESDWTTVEWWGTYAEFHERASQNIGLFFHDRHIDAIAMEDRCNDDELVGDLYKGFLDRHHSS